MAGNEERKGVPERPVGARRDRLFVTALLLCAAALTLAWMVVLARGAVEIAHGLGL